MWLCTRVRLRVCVSHTDGKSTCLRKRIQFCLSLIRTGSVRQVRLLPTSPAHYYDYRSSVRGAQVNR